MQLLRREARFTAAVVVALAVALIIATPGMRSAAIAADTAVRTPAVTQALDAVVALEHTADFAAFAATGDASAAQRLTDRFNGLTESSTWRQAAQDLVGGVSTNQLAGIPEAIEHINEGNERVLAIVNLFLVLILPGILACRIGTAADCITLWLLVFAGLSAAAAIGAAFEYVAAVLALLE